jgi:carboxymethylenebutenolidase
LLLQEIFGVNDYILATAGELANLGYVVLCHDVFCRVQPGMALPHDESALREGMTVAQSYHSEVDDDTRIGDLLAALDHVRLLDENTGGTGVIGYCLGGMLAYRVAAHGDVACCVSYYGSGIAGLLAGGERVSSPTLFHFGGADPYIPFEQVAQIVEGYAAQNNTEVVVQPGAGHAFENHLSHFSNPEAKARSWPVTVEFLRAQLMS